MAAGFIKEVSHPKWLANPILVKKKNGKWRMCVDYTGLNKHVQKSLSHYLESTKSLTPLRDAKPYLSLMHILVTIKLR